MDKIRTEQQQTATELQQVSSRIHEIEMDLAKRRQEFKDKEALEHTQTETREQISKLEKQSKVRPLPSPPGSRARVDPLWPAGPRQET